MDNFFLNTCLINLARHVPVRYYYRYYVVAWSRYLAWVYVQNTITLGVEFEHCEQLAKSIQIDQI